MQFFNPQSSAGQPNFVGQQTATDGQQYGQPYGQPGGQEYGQPYGNQYGQPYGQHYGQPSGDAYGGGNASGEDLLMQAKEQRRQEKQGKRQRKRHVDLENGVFAVQSLCGLAIVNTILLLVPLFGTSWKSKQLVGFGVRTMYLSSDIFMLELDVNCGKWNVIEEMVCKSFSQLSGRHTLHSSLQKACNLNGKACSVMTNVYTGSILLFGFFFLAVVFLLVGTVLLFIYWYSEPTTKAKLAARRCYSCCPVMVLAGIVVWSAITPDLDEIPRALTNSLGMLGGDNGIFSIKETNSFQYGWCWFAAIVAFIMVCVQRLCWYGLFVDHPDEVDEDAAEAEREERREEMVESGGGMFSFTPSQEASPLMLAEGPPPAYGTQGYSAPAGQQYQGPPQQQLQL